MEVKKKKERNENWNKNLTWHVVCTCVYVCSGRVCIFCQVSVACPIASWVEGKSDTLLSAFWLAAFHFSLSVLSWWTHICPHIAYSPHSICCSAVYPSLSPLQYLLPFSVCWRIISHDFGCVLCLKGDSSGTLRAAYLNVALFFILLPVMIMDVVWATVSSCLTWHASHTLCPTSCQ